MEFLTEMVRNIVAIILLASFLEMLLPASSIRPFVRFTIGLFVVIAILNPVFKIIYKSEDFKVDAWDMNWEQAKTQEVLEEGARLKQRLLQQSSETVKSKVEGQVKALAGLVPGVENLEARVEMDNKGNINNVLLVVETSPGESAAPPGEVKVFANQGQVNQADQKEIQTRIIDVVKNLYGLDASLIEVKFEGG